MVVSREDIRDWLKRGINKEGVEFMMVISDSFSKEYYPCYLQDGDEVREKINELRSGRNMTSVKEVYSYRKELEPQLNSMKAWEVNYND